MRKLLGGHTRTIRAPPSEVFELVAHPEDFDDEDGPDYDDAVGIHQQSTSGDAGRNARATTRANRTMGAASSGSASSPSPPSAGPAADAPARKARFDPNALDKWSQQAVKVQESLQGELSKLDDKFAKRVEALAEKFEKALSKTADVMAERDMRQRDHSAHLQRTLEKMMQTVAANVTDLKHADPIRDSIAELKSAPQRPPTVSLPVPPSTTLAVMEAPVDPTAYHQMLLALRHNRPLKTDAEGFKLGHVTPNEWEDINDDMKGVYAHRDRITTAQGYNAIRDRLCTNCPPDSANMPHRVRSCTLDWRSGKAGAAKLPEAASARGRQRVKDNLERLKHGQPAILQISVDIEDSECVDCTEIA